MREANQDVFIHFVSYHITEPELIMRSETFISYVGCFVYILVSRYRIKGLS